MKHTVWTAHDTREALLEFCVEFLIDEAMKTIIARERDVPLPIEMLDEPTKVPDARLANDIVHLTKCYTAGILSTGNFLRVVKDIAGG